MSLQVWLPLIKDLRNQGLSDVTVTNNGATFNSGGKLGGCYSFNGSSFKIVNTLPTTNTSSVGSLSCWFKMNSLPSSSSFYNLLQLGNLGGYATCRLGVYMEYDHYINISVDGSSTGTNRYTHSMVANQWYHLCVTNDGTTVKLYINGNEVLSKTVSKGSYTTEAQYLYIGGTSSYYLNGYMNDARYYDHALSPMEVKQISQGLVLHYPLDNNGFGNENLVLNSDTFATGSGASGITPSTTSDGLHQVIAASGDSNWHASWATSTATSLLENAFAEGDPFTISFTIKSENANKTNPPDIYVKSGMGYYSMQGSVTSNWSTVYYSGTWKDANSISFHLGFSGLVGTYLFKNWKVEKGLKPTPWCPNSSDVLATTMGMNDGIEYDCSGFGNNGTKIGELTYTTDTPRYTTSTHISAKTQKIYTTNFPTSGFGNSYTFAWWGKRNNNSPMFWGFADGIRLNGMYTGKLWNTGDGDNNPLYNIGTTTQVTAPVNNVWHHYAMTGNGTKCYVYLDGQLWAEAKTYKSISGTSFYINGWNSGTDYCSDNTSISDFRIYATALSAEDILALYNTAATIDNQGNLFTYEVVEG